jgi:hypothetical protein
MIDYLRMYLAIFGFWPGIPLKQQISFVIIWKSYKHCSVRDRMKRIAFITAFVVLLSGCRRGTSDAEFSRDVRLHLAASDRYHESKTVFMLKFSTVGKTVWPPHDSRLVLFVDGKEAPPPRSWGWAVITDHILPQRPRSAAWWMDLPELTNWIGIGEHELQMQFRSVKSNILKVTVPAEGRVQCKPELEIPSWEKVR